MVFLIRHTPRIATRSRFSSSLSELIIAVKDAEDRLATAEDLSEEDLEQLHQKYRDRAEQALHHLEDGVKGSADMQTERPS